jgi:hypothetical protein
VIDADFRASQRNSPAAHANCAGSRVDLYRRLRSTRYRNVAGGAKQ